MVPIGHGGITRIARARYVVFFEEGMRHIL
jgi:hypothetical protein